jgi:hypothetical protein
MMENKNGSVNTAVDMHNTMEYCKYTASKIVKRSIIYICPVRLFFGSKNLSKKQ